MEIKMDTSELDNAINNLESLEGEHQVPISELMTDSFMDKNTDYSTFDEFVGASGVLDEDFDGQQFSDFVSNNSEFDNWEEMVQSAANIWVEKKLENL